MAQVDPILSTAGLTQSFGSVVAVDDLSIGLREGETVGIVGSNGSGKTTLLNLVTGYLQPSAGSIRFAGREIAGLGPREVTLLGIARSFQIPQLFSGMSVLDNLLVAIAGRSGTGWDPWRPLHREEWVAEAAGLLAQFGLDGDAGAMAESLPEGSRKLLDVALSFVLGPRMLLMDEPTSGVSTGDKFKVMDVLLGALGKTGVTTVFIEHDMEIVERYADRALAFHDGRVIADGPVSDVLADPAVKSTIMGSG